MPTAPIWTVNPGAISLLIGSESYELRRIRTVERQMHKINSLAEELNRWYKEKCQDGNLSWTNLHKATGVSVPYIVKLAQGKGNPSYEKEKALLSETCDDIKAIYNYLKAKHPKSVVSLEEFTSDKDNNRKLLTDGTLDPCQDESTMRIFYLSSSGTFTIQQVVDLIGKKAYKHIELLQSAGIIEVKDGVVLRNSAYKNTLTNKLPTLIKTVRHNLKLLEEKHYLAKYNDGNGFNSSNNKVGTLVKNLNQNGIDTFVADFFEFLEKEIVKLNDSRYVGDVPMFYNFVLGRYDEE